MQSSATTGLKLIRTPSVRDLARRRWQMLLAAFLGLALAGGAVGHLTSPQGPPPSATGPFSYYPS